MHRVSNVLGEVPVIAIAVVIGLAPLAHAETTVNEAVPSATPATGGELSADRTANTEPLPTNASTDDSSGGLLGPIRLGPMVGVGLPNLLNIGGLVKFGRYFSAGVNLGLIPALRISYYGEATVAYREYDVYGHVYPFGGGFFLGASIGYVTVRGTMVDTLDTSGYANLLPANLVLANPLTYQSQGSVKTMVITPQVGYLYTTKIGFTIGVDVGAHIPIKPSQVRYESQLTLPPNTPQPVAADIRASLLDPNDQKVRDTLQTIGRTPLPTITLRIGWLL
jgi:hypothetical protein